MDSLSLYYLGALLIALGLGVTMAKTEFCIMGAITDRVVMGDSARLLAWWLAIGVATFMVALLRLNYSFDPQNSVPSYTSAHFAWLRFFLGGVLFGGGMILTGGCALRSCVKATGGNLKSVFVLIVMALSAYAMIPGGIYTDLFYPWIRIGQLDLSSLGGADLPHLFGRWLAPKFSHLGIALMMLISAGFGFVRLGAREDIGTLLLSGLSLGGAVSLAWWLSIGEIGQQATEQALFSDFPPVRIGAQGISLVQPFVQAMIWIQQGLERVQFSFSVAILFGTLLGALSFQLSTGRWRWQWFQDPKDLLWHFLGAISMGVGGILALGCTVGQGVTGLSTLALGSILATASIIVGATFTLSLRYRIL